jgi:hypothetical protein
VWGWIPESESARDLQEAAKLGADTVRVVVPWDYLQTVGPGEITPYVAGVFDRLMAVAHQEHLRVVASVVGTPCWASTAPHNADGSCSPSVNARIFPPTHASDFQAVMKQIADRWGDRIVGYEVWNEPNHPGFWNGTPAQYVELVRAAHDGVKASAHPDAPIVAGGLSGSDTAYLQKLYDNGVDRWSDAISIHPYSIRWELGMASPLWERAGDIWSFASGVPAVHTLMQANGDNSDIWITEFGYATCDSNPLFCVSAQQQGEWNAAAMRRAAEWNYVNTFILYDLRDWNGPGAGISQQFGVLDANWQPKAGTAPVKAAFADLG